MKKSTYVFILVLVVIIIGIVYFSNRGTVNQPAQPVSQNTGTGVPTISSQSVVNGNPDPAAAVLAGAKTIIWQTSNYPAGAGVNINLLRQTSDSPRKFVMVRTIVTNTPNDGQETWVPKAGENTGDLYVEVTCSNVYQFNSGCKISDGPLKLN